MVVLLHGSDGVHSPSARDWTAFLNKIGNATFRLDSFGARGLTNVAADQSKLSIYAQVIDAYRAVEVVAKHPRIDPSRIAVMGFSRGGIAALYASMQRFHESYGPAGVSIAAYLPFYPSCGIRLVNELDVASAPIREFHGAADDWTPAAPCRNYFDRLQATGKDAVMTEYPGARHAFDDSSAKTPLVVDGAQTLRNCRRHEENGTIVNDDTEKPFTYSDACVEHGPTVGYDRAATEAAHTAVQKFLTGLFRLN